MQLETDSAIILTESYKVLDQVAASIQGHPEVLLVEVQGRADERNSDEYNRNLTRDRANAELHVRDRRAHPAAVGAAGSGPPAGAGPFAAWPGGALGTGSQRGKTRMVSSPATYIHRPKIAEVKNIDE